VCWEQWHDDEGHWYYETSSVGEKMEKDESDIGDEEIMQESKLGGVTKKVVSIVAGNNNQEKRKLN